MAGVDQRQEAGGAATGGPATPLASMVRAGLGVALALLLAGGAYLLVVRGEAAFIDLYAASSLLLCF